MQKRFLSHLSSGLQAESRCAQPGLMVVIIFYCAIYTHGNSHHRQEKVKLSRRTRETQEAPQKFRYGSLTLYEE